MPTPERITAYEVNLTQRQVSIVKRLVANSWMGQTRTMFAQDQSLEGQEEMLRRLDSREVFRPGFLSSVREGANSFDAAIARQIREAVDAQLSAHESGSPSRYEKVDLDGLRQLFDPVNLKKRW